MIKDTIRLMTLRPDVLSKAIVLLSLHQVLPPLDCVLVVDPTGASTLERDQLDCLLKMLAANGITGLTYDGHSTKKIRSCSGFKPPRPTRQICESSPSINPLFSLSRQEREIDAVARTILRLEGNDPLPADCIIEHWHGGDRYTNQDDETNNLSAIRHVRPLSDLGMTKNDCINWLAAHGYTG